jgi:hypothetical protein
LKTKTLPKDPRLPAAFSVLMNNLLFVGALAPLS